MKKLFTFLLALIAGAGTLFSASGTCGKDGNNLTWTLTDDGVMTISGTGQMETWSSDYTVPWSSNRSDIKSLVIEDGVTSIGGFAFFYCKNMTSVRIGNTVTTIGGLAFSQCLGLTSITIPNSVTSIGASAFYYCKQLASITCIASTLPYCGDNCFGDVDKSIPVYVPAKSIYSYTKGKEWSDFTNIQALKCGANLTWDLTDGVLTISGTGAMTSWTRSTDVPWYQFRSTIKSVVLEEGVTRVGSLAFSGYTNMTSISLPSTLTLIDSYSLYGCTGLTSITIPSNVATIDEGALKGCTGLTSLTLPASVMTLGDGAFSDCTGLTSITCKATTPPTCEDDCFENLNKSMPVYVPKGSVAQYKAADYWKNFTNIQATECLLGSGTCGANGSNLTWELDCDGLLTISGTGDMADYTGSTYVPWFTLIGSVKSIVIEEGVASLGSLAFANCYMVTAIDIPNSVINIDASAFLGCSALTSISVKSGNTKLSSENGVLFNKDKTTLVRYPIGKQGVYSIPTSVIGIGTAAFNGCSGLTSVTIPDGVTSIGNYAFAGCTGLKSITCEAETPPTCGDNCFSEVDKSIPVYVPQESVNNYKIEWSYFTNFQASACKPVSGTCGTNVTWTLDCDGVLTISGTGAMDDCIKENLVYLPWEDYVSSIKSVVIEEGVTSIGEGAFFACTAITSITIPNSVSSVGYHAFYLCSGLTSPVYNSQIFACLPTSYTGAYVIPDGIKTIAGGAFYDCDGLTSVTIPSSVTSIGDYAFNDCDGLTSITCKALIPPTFGEGCFSNSNIPVYVPAQSVAAYLAEDCEWRFFDIQPIVELPASGTCGDNLTWTLSEDGLLTISGTGAMTEFFSSSDDRPWVYFLAYIKSVVIEEGVTSIGMGAFAYCKALTSVTIPSSVTGIGYGAFLNCSGLASITIAATTPPTCGEYCFEGVDKSIPVNVPAGCATVYSGWNGFTNIKAPEKEELKISDLAAKNITTTSATISWKGSGETYDLRYHVYNVYDFEEGLAPWTSYDTDGDGHEWEWHTSATFHTHNGSAGCAGSASYDASTSSALTPNNWLVSPEVTLGGSMTFWATAQDPAYAAEHFQVYVSTDGATFAAVSNEYVCPTGRDYRLYTADLSKFSGKGYVAICHFNCTDMYWLNIDDIEIIEPGAITEVDGLTATNYALSGLTAGTTYSVEVRSHYGTMVGEWTQIIFKTAANDEDAAAAKAVVDLIDAIGTPVTLASETAIVAARTAYDKLTDAQKELVSNYDVLVAAEEALADAKEAATWQGWTYYDNKDYDVSYGAYTDAVRWGILVPASSQTSTKLTKIALYEAEGTATEDITLTVYNGGDLPDEANSIYTETFSPEAADKFQIVTLANPVTIDPTKNVWIVMASKNSFPMSFTKTRYVENACWLYSNSTWYEISELVEGAWKIRALFEEEEEDMPVVPAGTVPYKLVDLSKESVTAGEYIIVFDDNKAHAAVSGKDLIASSDELTFEDDYAFVPEEAVCAVTIAPLGTDSFSILLADGTSYMDQTAKNSVTTSANPSAFAITDGGDQNAQISKTISDGKSYVLKHNGNYFRMYSSTTYSLPKLYRKVAPVTYHIRFLNEDGTVLQESDIENGATPVYEGATPVKEATAQYTYTFTGWDKPIVAASEDIDYTAVFESTLRSYTVTFKDEDGTTLDSRLWDYGTTPSCTEPSKPSTAQYNYTFKGWTPDVVAVSKDATYTAVYDAALRSYTVTWINGDGTTLVEESYNYGTTPVYKGSEPTRPATEQYTYTFNGYWSPSVAPVTGDATYEAQFWATVRNYTVTWKMDDGTVIDETSWPYGEKPSHADPEKPATAQYEYTFKGWTPEVVEVIKDATYTAVFEEKLRSYTVTWVNWDGTELDKETYNYGTTPVYKGSEPTRPATAENTFTFSGWSPAIAAVTGDITYKAQFNSTGQTYTVTWKMDDGSVLATETYAYGDLPNYTDPVKPATAQYEYTFKGWTPEVTAVSGDATYTAVFEETLRSYTVTWVNWDGTELDKETYNYGTTPIYKGSEPTRPATAQYEYTFKGWTPEVAAVSKDATYTAVFEQTLRSYTITFVVGPVNYPVTVEYGTPMNALMAGLWAEAQAEYGFTQDIEGNYQYSDGINIYTFTGWDKEIPETVIGEAAYTATYTITPLQPTAVEEMSIVNCQLSTKFVRDGQLYILRDGKVYTVTGQVIK